MSSPEFIITEYVCPSLGVIMSTLTFMAPVKSLKFAIKEGNLGNLNPTPWAFMTGNCIGWLAFSYITLDLFVFWANAPGLMISVWLNVGAMKLQYYEQIKACSVVQLTDRVEENGGTNTNSINDEEGIDDDRNSTQGGEQNLHRPISGTDEKVLCSPPSTLTSHERKLIQIVIIWIIILSLTSFIPALQPDMKFIVGVAVNINLIFFYAAPLSTIVTVIRTKNSSSIHFRTMMMNTTNAFFWVVYSLAIMDPYIFVPNGLGFLFGLVQMVLYRVFPRVGNSVSEGNEATEQFLDESGESPHVNIIAENEVI